MPALFVSGTDTDVGKTVVSAALTYYFATEGKKTEYFKPVLSGALKTAQGWLPEDAAFVTKTSGIEPHFDKRVPYCFEIPASPHLASQIEQRPIDPIVIQKSYEVLSDHADMVIVEGAGGIACPISVNDEECFMTSDLIHLLNIPVILVCRAGVGTLNHTLTAVTYARAKGISILGLVVNGYEDTVPCNDNLNMLERLTDCPILARLPKADAAVTPELVRLWVDTLWKPYPFLLQSMI